MDAPCEHNVSLYAEMLKKKNVKYLVRACEPSYEAVSLNKAGIVVRDFPIKDGESPSTRVLYDWLDFVDSQFSKSTKKSPNPNHSHSQSQSQPDTDTNTTAKTSSKSKSVRSPSTLTSSSFSATSTSPNTVNNTDNIIAVHCVAGRGRAPLLVVIALIERGMDRYEAITLVRQKRRGALNSKQLKYIENYQTRDKASRIIC